MRPLGLRCRSQPGFEGPGSKVRSQFHCERSEAPEGRAEGSGNLGSDPQNARSHSVRAELVEAFSLDLITALFAKFRCRSVAAAGDSLFFASPKKPKEKKGDPGVC